MRKRLKTVLLVVAAILFLSIALNWRDIQQGYVDGFRSEDGK